jgi:hypothetical protein
MRAGEAPAQWQPCSTWGAFGTKIVRGAMAAWNCKRLAGRAGNAPGLAVTRQVVVGSPTTHGSP